MLITYLGNFGPPHSTENDVRRALQGIGCTVTAIQEGDGSLIPFINGTSRPDFVLWTRTASLSNRWPIADRWRMLAELRRRGIPTVGYHLDRWWGLKRQNEVHDDPFFHVDLLCTADGAHDHEWAKIGVTHQWMPPGISSANCGVGTPRDEYRSDIAFVGNWQDYHPEWKHRMELVNWLGRTYGDRVRFWPKKGEHAIRGRELADLYASTKVVVGDSCLVPKTDGSPMSRYCSDRIPETLGRGGNLIHPSVDGIDDLYGFQFARWPLGDFGVLRRLIDDMLNDPDDADNGRLEATADYIRDEHSYETRMMQLLGHLTERGMISQ